MGMLGRLALLLFCMSCIVSADDDPRTASIDEVMLYVLLDKKAVEPGELWTITSPRGVKIYDLFCERRYDSVPDGTLTIEQSAVGRVESPDEPLLLINGRAIAPRALRIESIEGPLALNGVSYAGVFYIISHEQSWYIINRVALEEYVYSVLGSESWPGWPLEVDKVFAIMIRTYAVDKIMRARGKRKIGKGFLYDMVSTNAHQTYKGIHNRHALREAVELTRGRVLMHDGKPIEAMYDTCCGGVIPAHMHLSKKKRYSALPPYLARTYACTFCTDCKAYSWTARYTLDEAIALLQKVDARVDKLHSIHVGHVDKAGLVHEVIVRFGKHRIVLSGQKMYALFKDVKSFCFSVTKSGSSLVFKGTGYGHHRGLCQWGAREMIKRGWDCTSVLHFYYPETSIMKLAYKMVT